MTNNVSIVPDVVPSILCLYNEIKNKNDERVLHMRSRDRLSATDLVAGISLLFLMALTQTIYLHLASGDRHCFSKLASFSAMQNRKICDYQNIEMQPDPIGDI